MTGSLAATRPVVLISAAVFETPRWVDTLLLNARHFTEASTRVMLHLNALTNYADSEEGGGQGLQAASVCAVGYTLLYAVN